MNDTEDVSIPVLILDPGSWMIKIGLVDNEMPSYQIPCVYLEKTYKDSKIIKFGNEAVEDYILIKYGKNNNSNINDNLYEQKVNDLKNVKMNFADPRHPLSRNNFIDLFETYNYLINKMNINTSNYHLLVSIPEKIEHLFLNNLLIWAFNNHDFLSISLMFNSMLASYYYGINTTLIIDFGEYSTRIIPIAEEHGIFNDCIKICEIGGYIISKYISNFVKLNDTNLDYILIQNYKELNSYVSLDIENNIKINTNCNGIIKPYQIANTNIYLDPKVELLSHEIFFQPEFLAHLPGYFFKQNIIPLSQLIFECISLCPLDLRKALLNNIMLIGGISNCINLNERLQNELYKMIKNKKYHKDMTINIRQIKMSELASYLGCRKYGKLLFYNKKKWIKKEEYLNTPKSEIIKKLLIWANVF